MSRNVTTDLRARYMIDDIDAYQPVLKVEVIEVNDGYQLNVDMLNDVSYTFHYKHAHYHEGGASKMLRKDAWFVANRYNLSPEYYHHNQTILWRNHAPYFVYQPIEPDEDDHEEED